MGSALTRSSQVTSNDVPDEEVPSSSSSVGVLKKNEKVKVTKNINGNEERTTWLFTPGGQRKSVRARRPKLPFGGVPEKISEDSKMTCAVASSSVARFGKDEVKTTPSEGQQQQSGFIHASASASQQVLENKEKDIMTCDDGSSRKLEHEILLVEVSKTVAMNTSTSQDAEKMKAEATDGIAPRRRPRKQARRNVPLEKPADKVKKVECSCSCDDGSVVEQVHYSRIFDDDWQDQACDCNEYLRYLFLD